MQGSPYINRFLQPDTVMPDLSDPQSRNRYAYGLNNPLRYTDPTGHWVLETNKPEHEQRRNAYKHAAERIKKKDAFSTHLQEYYSTAAAYYEAVASEDHAENIQTQLLHLEDKRNNVLTNGWNGVDAAQSVAVDASGFEVLGIGTFGVHLAGVIFPNRPNINFSPDEGGGGRPHISPSESPLWKDLNSYQGKIKTAGSGRDQQFYRWDYSHGDVEVYDRNGWYIGSMDPISGELYRPATKKDMNRNIFK